MKLDDDINRIREEIRNFEPGDFEDLENFRIKYLGKKGRITALFKEFKNVPKEQKKEYGEALNHLKGQAQRMLEDYRQALEAKDQAGKGLKIDLTLDPAPLEAGSRHPVNIVRNRIVRIFSNLGYNISEGPEIVDDWHNFTALNIPENHPARDMQDTFFVRDDLQMVLRTHTSPVQVQVMQNTSPPIRTISPGRVFRKDSDATHSPFFHQVEGLYVDEAVSLADLKQNLYYFVKEMFGDQTEIRFRPSYFPFTEPSAEMDIRWQQKGKKQWMEILGCGMVDPNVLENCGIDNDRYSGFAFGMGVERIAMLKYGIRDIRTFFENDVRLLKQFKTE